MNPLLQKFLDGQLPEAMAHALVGGALPLPTLELLHALAFTVFQESPLQEKAKETLAQMPEAVLQSAVVGPVEPPDILGLLAIFRHEPGLLETVLLHENLTAEWMERVVPHLPGSALEIPLNNQRLWIERPAILDLIEAHPDCEYNLKRKINEFRRDVLRQISEDIAKDRLEIIDAVESGRLDRAWSELPLPTIQGDADKAEPEAPPVAAPLDDAAKELLGDLLGEDNGHFQSVTARMLKLSPNQKAVLAMKGGKEERVHLIRESNRVIQLNVIRNPRITEAEIVYIAQMRSVNDEVLRVIGTSREWTRKYQIIKNLVLNPKTPPALSLTHLKRFNDFDLRQLARDRNVSEVLRREAGRMMTQRLNKQ